MAGKTSNVDLSENRHVQVVSKSKVDENSLLEISETVLQEYGLTIRSLILSSMQAEASDQ